MIVVSCVNLKGGVGKTTLAVNLAAYFGGRGLKTLLVDLDPQTNATFSTITPQEWEKHANEHGTVADLLGARKHTNANAKQKTLDEVVRKNIFKNVDLVPSHLDLFTIDLDMAGATARETRLKKALASSSAGYEIVICDCPPNLTIPTQNALASSSHFIVPISADFLSALGVGILLGRIKQLGQDLDQPVTLAGIVISRVGRPAYHRDDIVLQLKKQFGDGVLKNQLTERVRVAEAASKQHSVFDHADSQSVTEFTAVCYELGKRIGVLK